MFSSLTNPNIVLGGLILATVQILAALPWIYAIDSATFKKTINNPLSLLYALGGFIGAGLFFAIMLGYRGDSAGITMLGRIYGAALTLQILIDLFIYIPLLLTVIAPKMGAVALASYREGWRQPMFWLITLAAIVLTWIAVVLPYFTFGDDFKMMKQIGFDIVMLAGILFGVLQSSISISEEIEGRTALTVMSKPVNRRQFLLGKFFGILMACAAMSLLLSINLNVALLANVEFDQINKDNAVDPMVEESKSIVVPAVMKLVPSGPARTMMIGTGLWFAETMANSLGILLGFGQVMILVAVTTALATRLPFIINLVICLMLYFLGHLAPVVVRVTEKMSSEQNSGIGLVKFFGNVFDTLLPALEFFSVGPAIIREAPLGLGDFTWFTLTVTGYALIYTFIAMLVGLLLFEDRDLA
jgi:ABC-type transport system involved in multi-copper enzyme maturation permease subunit